jgi:hypothetical protein
MALDPNMMQWISMLVYDELQKCCEELSLNGEDRKLYDICLVDLRNYLSYLDRNCQKLESESPELKIEREELGDILSVVITNRLYGLHDDMKSTIEVKEFIHWWVKWWFKKWQERTQVIFKDQPSKFNVDSIVPNPFNGVERDELMQATRDKLIQCGEICCSSILAEAVFKKDMQASDKRDWSIQDKINLVSRLQREAREMSYTHGVLVFIKPDKRYGLREWRDDNANKIV